MLLFAADIVVIALDDYYQYYHLLLVVAGGGVGVDPAPDNASGRGGASSSIAPHPSRCTVNAAASALSLHQRAPWK